MSHYIVGSDKSGKNDNDCIEKVCQVLRGMTLSIKALLPEIEKPVVEEEKPAKGKKRAKREAEESDGELREWKDNTDSGVSIADLLGNN